MIWKISREHIILAGGAAAAILQTAHPSVGHGVANYSSFRRDTFGRLTRTLFAVYTIAFGTREEADKIARRVRLQHERVRSREGEPPYSAMDDDLQLWVLATLVMCAVPLYERFVAPLTAREKENYLSDMRKWGAFFGVPPDYGPQGWTAFGQYYQEMLNGEILASEPVCMDAAQQIASPKKPLWMALLMKPLRFHIVETLPSPARERLGFRSTIWTRTAWRVTASLLKCVYPFLPKILRHPQQYLRACKRATSSL